MSAEERSTRTSQRTRSASEGTTTEVTFQQNWLPEEVMFFTGANIEPNLLGAVKAILDPLRALLEPSWALLGPSWDPLRGLLGPSWPLLG